MYTAIDIIDSVRYCSSICKYLDEEFECLNPLCIQLHCIAYDMLLDGASHM